MLKEALFFLVFFTKSPHSCCKAMTHCIFIRDWIQRCDPTSFHIVSEAARLKIWFSKRWRRLLENHKMEHSIGHLSALGRNLNVLRRTTSLLFCHLGYWIYRLPCVRIYNSTIPPAPMKSQKRGTFPNYDKRHQERGTFLNRHTSFSKA